MSVANVRTVPSSLGRKPRSILVFALAGILLAGTVVAARVSASGKQQVPSFQPKRGEVMVSAPTSYTTGEQPRPAPKIPNVSSAVWAGAPTLGAVPGERYQGRIVVEIGSNGGQVNFMPIATRQLVGRATAALNSSQSFPATPALWPAIPITGSVRGGGTFEGRIVIELWDTTTNVAVTLESGSQPALVQRSLQAIGHFGS